MKTFSLDMFKEMTNQQTLVFLDAIKDSSNAQTIENVYIGAVNEEKVETVFNFLKSLPNLQLIKAGVSFMDMELSGTQCMVENLFSDSAKKFLTYLKTSKYIENIERFRTAGMTQDDDAAFDLLFDSIQASKKFSFLSMPGNELSPMNSVKLLNALCNSQSVQSLEVIDMSRSINFSSDEACTLLAELISKASNVKALVIHQQNFARATRQVIFDVTYATDDNKGKVKATDKNSYEVICEVEIERSKQIPQFVQ